VLKAPKIVPVFFSGDDAASGDKLQLTITVASASSRKYETYAIVSKANGQVKPRAPVDLCSTGATLC
jgi:hypothetical protein